MQGIYLRFKDGKSKALTLSYDDGVEQDIRLINLMEKYGIKGTFNISSGFFPPEDYKFAKGQIHRRLSKSKVNELYKSPAVEIAIHAKSHPFLTKLPSSVVAQEILEDRDNLENMFGRIVRGMAYPYGAYDDRVVDILAMSGIVYSRMTVSNEDFRLPADWLRWETTCHHKNVKLNDLTDEFITGIPDRDPYLFYLWGHSYEFEANDNWNVIEEFFEKVSGNDNVWYATNMEIYEYIEAFRQLVYSADGKIINNPTATDVWVMIDNEIYEIPSGKNTKIK